MSPDRRKANLRRDLNDLVRDPSGKVSEAKAFTVVFKGAMLYVFLKHAEMILKDWIVLAVFVTAMIAPDIMKKILVMRAGAVPPK
jgi:hypothetical protein